MTAAATQTDEITFTEDDYRGRARLVRERMAERDVDVLFVMKPANLYYLTGFQSIWYPPRAPLGVVLSRHDERLVFLDYERHRTLVETTAHFDDAIFYAYETALATVADAFRARGWAQGRVGIEWWTGSPGAPLVREVARSIEDAGAAVVDGDWIVDRVRLVKSEKEIACVRRAAAIVDAAFDSLLEYVQPGRTELEIAAHLDATMASLGGERPAIITMVSAGPDVWCRTHSPPSRRPVQAGDVMYVDACGVVNRYHADLCRTFAIGRDHPAARAILDVTAGSVDEVRRAVRPGDPLDVAQRVAEEYVYGRFPRERVWWVGGYALGIAMPPDWVGHTYLSNDAFERFTWEPGYVTNYENILFDRDAGFTASYMETLLMTADGIETLARRPRTLTVIAA
jgi:Xaa-Pro aminopeptidase